MNAQVTDYINQAADEQRKIMEVIRRLIHDTVTGVTEEFKWSRPVFKKSRNFAYLKTAKSYVTLGFFNFNRIDDNQNKLEGTGNEMRHIKIKTMSEIDSDVLKKWFLDVSK